MMTMERPTTRISADDWTVRDVMDYLVSHGVTFTWYIRDPNEQVVNQTGLTTWIAPVDGEHLFKLPDLELLEEWRPRIAECLRALVYAKYPNPEPSVFYTYRVTYERPPDPPPAAA